MTMPSAYNVSSEEDVGSFPASFAQQWLWFLDPSEPNTATYNLTSAVRISIPLDLEALEQSLYALVQRHAVLRTTFVVKNEQLMQVISPTVNEELDPRPERAGKSPSWWISTPSFHSKYENTPRTAGCSISEISLTVSCLR